MARAHVDGERAVLVESLEAALRINGKHVPSLLLLADHRIDAEDYAGAAKLLDDIQAINPWHPDAWAYRAVLAHLRNDPAAETAARAKALRHWTNNPRVDHLVGLKLSQKYRFSEGAARQRQSLGFDPSYLPAKAQLSSDLLRLGEEEEGWRLAREVHDRDGYDVSAYNLVTLHDTMGKYATLTNAHFVVRMSSREAAVYGSRVLELLGRARAAFRQVRHRTEVTDDRGDLRRAKGFRGAHVRDARQPGLSGGLFRSGGHRQRARGDPRARRQLGGRAVARVHPRDHPPNDRQPDAALAERGHLGPRGTAGQPGVGPTHGTALPRHDPRRRTHPDRRPQRCLSLAQVPAPPPVRLLRGLPRRGPHCRSPWHRGAQGRAPRPPRRGRDPGRPRRPHRADEGVGEILCRVRGRPGPGHGPRPRLGKAPGPRRLGRRRGNPRRMGRRPSHELLGAAGGRPARHGRQGLVRRETRVAATPAFVPGTDRCRQRLSTARVRPPDPRRDQPRTPGPFGVRFPGPRGPRRLPAPDGTRHHRRGLAGSPTQRGTVPRREPTARATLPAPRRGRGSHRRTRRRHRGLPHDAPSGPREPGGHPLPTRAVAPSHGCQGRAPARAGSPRGIAAASARASVAPAVADQRPSVPPVRGPAMNGFPRHPPGLVCLLLALAVAGVHAQGPGPGGGLGGGGPRRWN
ncbi:MAG: hypothetical protein DVB31_13730, partial [Verrucomicrobia bacterium]